MTYVNTTTLELTNLSAIRAQHPQVSIPDGADLTELGFGLLVDTPPPSAPGKKIVAGPPAFSAGAWRKVWVVSDYTAGELDTVKATSGDRIEAECERRTKLGGVVVGTNRYKTDADTRTQLALLTQKGNGVPGQKKIRALDANGKPVLVNVNQALLKDITDAIVARDFALEQVAETHMTAMAVAVDPDKYDFSGGWPT